MQIRVFTIEEECIRSPDLLKELPVHGQLTDDVRLVELEPLVVPILPGGKSYFTTQTLLKTTLRLKYKYPDHCSYSD